MDNSSQQQQRQPKNVKDMSKEELDDYLSQGTYGVQKLYHDSGSPEKAEEYGNIQREIQNKVYNGQSSLFEIEDKDKLSSAVRTARAVQKSYNALSKDSTDQDVSDLAANIASTGGPDFRSYSPDIQRQGMSLWSKTFDEQMASIASSPRGREKYGDMLHAAYDDQSNDYMFNLGKANKENSADGRDAKVLQQYVVGHWSNPRLSDSPEPSQPNLGVSDLFSKAPEGQQPVEQQGAMGSLIQPRTDQAPEGQQPGETYSQVDKSNLLKSAGAALQNKDTESMFNIVSEVNKLNIKNPISTATPYDMASGLSKITTITQQLENNDLAASGAIDKAEAAKRNDKLDVLDMHVQAESLIDKGTDAQDPKIIEQGKKALQEADMRRRVVNREYLNKPDADLYTKQVTEASTNLTTSTRKVQVLSQMISNMVALGNSGRAKETGQFGHIGDTVNDLIAWVHNTDTDAGDALKSALGNPQGSNEQIHKLAYDYVTANGQPPRGTALSTGMKPLIDADIGSLVEMFKQEVQNSQGLKSGIKNLDDYIDEKGTMSGAPAVAGIDIAKTDKDTMTNLQTNNSKQQSIHDIVKSRTPEQNAARLAELEAKGGK